MSRLARMVSLVGTRTDLMSPDRAAESVRRRIQKLNWERYGGGLAVRLAAAVGGGFAERLAAFPLC
jgi:hypothetical protein